MNNETGKKSNAWLIPVVIGTFVGAAALSCAMFFLVFKKPLEAALLFKEGIEAAENGDMDGFMDKGGAVLGLDEDYMNKRFLESFLREDLYEAAIPVYERLIKNNPDNVEYYVGLAEAKKKCEDWEGALDVLLDALDKFENDNDVEELLDSAYDLIDDMPEAEYYRLYDKIYGDDYADSGAYDDYGEDVSKYNSDPDIAGSSIDGAYTFDTYKGDEPGILIVELDDVSIEVGSDADVEDFGGMVMIDTGDALYTMMAGTYPIDGAVSDMNNHLSGLGSEGYKIDEDSLYYFSGYTDVVDDIVGVYYEMDFEENTGKQGILLAYSEKVNRHVLIMINLTEGDLLMHREKIFDGLEFFRQ